MAIPEVSGARERATLLLTALLERFQPRTDWRHTDVAEIVDVLIEAAREPASAHTRAVAAAAGGAVEDTALRTERPFGRRSRGDHGTGLEG